MSDAKAHFADDSLDPASSSGARPSISANDDLATHRLSAMRPPRPDRASSYPTMPPPPSSSESKTSWWRALLSSTLAPPAVPSGIAARHHEHGQAPALRVGMACASLALALPFAALLACLWSLPSTSSVAVAVTVVVGRVTFALALLAFALAILRVGERFLSASGAQGSDTTPR
jgi:hypothetical protein